MHDLEIVGLKSSTNGRSCCLHSCCGEEVTIGTILRLVKCTVAVDGTVEEAVKCVRVIEGIDGCTVGFVPRVLMKCPGPSPLSFIMALLSSESIRVASLICAHVLIIVRVEIFCQE